MTSYLLHQLWASLASRPEWQAMLKNADFQGLSRVMGEVLPWTYHYMPRTLRMLFKVLQKVIDFVSILSQAFQESSDTEKFILNASNRINTKIDEKLQLLLPDLSGLWILLVMNFVVFFLLKIFL